MLILPFKLQTINDSKAVGLLYALSFVLFGGHGSRETPGTYRRHNKKYEFINLHEYAWLSVSHITDTFLLLDIVQTCTCGLNLTPWCALNVSFFFFFLRFGGSGEFCVLFEVIGTDNTHGLMSLGKKQHHSQVWGFNDESAYLVLMSGKLCPVFTTLSIL